MFKSMELKSVRIIYSIEEENRGDKPIRVSITKFVLPRTLSAEKRKSSRQDRRGKAKLPFPAKLKWPATKLRVGSNKQRNINIT